MLIYDTLKKDHDALKGLLQQLVNLSDDSGQERKRLLNEIRDGLIPHSRAEEAVFYNSIRLADTGKKIALHGYKEHMEAEALLRSLQMETSIHAGWQKTARKLQEAIEHHISEEETEVFAAARSLFTDQEAEQMSNAFEKLKPEVKEEGFFGNTLSMIKNLMPPHLAKAVDEVGPVQPTKGQNFSESQKH